MTGIIDLSLQGKLEALWTIMANRLTNETIRHRLSPGHLPKPERGLHFKGLDNPDDLRGLPDFVPLVGQRSQDSFWRDA